MTFSYKKPLALLICLCLLLTITAQAAFAAVSKLVPSGLTLGVRLSAGCLYVMSLSSVTTEDATVAPAEDAGLAVGDRITHIAGKPAGSIAGLQELLAENDGKPLSLRVVRGGHTLTLTLSPAKSVTDGLYKIGALLRDSMAGIGTMTFYDPENKIFGALGHGISDVKSDRLMPMDSGIAVTAEITGVRKGESGNPGELLGTLDDEKSGTIYANTDFGIYGYITDDALVPSGQALEVANPKQVTAGPVTILSCVDGFEVQPYQAEIVRVYPGSSGPRSFMLRITDTALIERTGGIVQGMSGSPVIQEGRLVGAVTHVMVGDPLRGYGLFASRMLETALDNHNAAAA